MKEIKTLKDLENAVAITTKRKKTEMAILGSIATAGFLAAVAVAPNAVQILQYMVPDTRPLSHKQSVRRAIGRLIKEGHIHKNGKRYVLTEKGKKYLERTLTLSGYTHKNRKWDGKWRIVIFDIKETQRAKRDELRSLLIRSGFSKLQESVWVYPFRCDEVIALLKFKLTLGWNLVYIIADAIEGDKELKRHYGIK